MFLIGNGPGDRTTHRGRQKHRDRSERVAPTRFWARPELVEIRRDAGHDRRHRDLKGDSGGTCGPVSRRPGIQRRIGEASGPIPAAARFCWVLDPIDGTNNYAIGIPYCAISLALLEQGVPVYGVIYDFARRKLLCGGPGFGAFDGGKSARARRDPPREGSLIGFHSPYDKTLVRNAPPIIQRFKIRGLGSSTLHLAYVGIGLLDGVVDFNVRVWDIAAAHAIALGGGAEIHYLKNNPFPMQQFDPQAPRIHYLAGNTEVCACMKELLAGA